MSKYKKIFFSLLLLCFSISSILYIIFLTIVPIVCSSYRFLDIVGDFIAQKTGIIFKSEKLNVRTYPSLVIDIKADKLKLTSKDEELFKARNVLFSYDLKRFNIKKVDIEYIYINQKNIDTILNENKHKKTSDYKFKSLPQVHIAQAEIWADKGKEYSVFVDIDNILIKNENGKTKCSFQAEIISGLLENVVKIGENGYLYVKDNKLYAQNLEILIGNSLLMLDGKITDSKKQTDLFIKGSDLPISDIMSSLLYFQKKKDPSKKFLDNFYDYSGKMHIDVEVTEKGAFGECHAINLAAKSVLFNVPILFEHVPFTFNKREFKGGAFGTLGGEKVYSDFILTDIATEKYEAKGSVHSVLTNKSIGKYVPYASIDKGVDASVDWKIKNKIIDVAYKVFLPVGSDIYYQNVFLGESDKNRMLYASTQKKDIDLKLTQYGYSIEQNGKYLPIIKGDGLFKQINGKMMPDYITCGTVNDAPVSIAGSFYKYIKGGVFNGQLKYDFNKNKITGKFNIKNSLFKDYKIDEAKVEATEKNVTVQTNGKFKNSDFNAYILGLNNFNDKIHIYKLDLYLDEIIINPKKKNKKDKKDVDIKLNENIIKEKTDNFNIDSYIIKMNKIKYRKAVFSDILVMGSIKNNIFNFNVPHIKFAKGLIKANGLYDFNKRISDVTFFAENIDSNTVADELFNLPAQIQGTANAKLRVKTTNGIEDKHAHADFIIKQGYLEKLGSTAFMLKKIKVFNKSFTIQDALNVDITNMKALASDIKGDFDIDNAKITNANITSSQKYLSMLVMGDYDIEKQYADLDLFGQYNNSKVSKIKIFYIPLSFIIKVVFSPEKTKARYINTINKLPKINIERKEDLKFFRIKVNGNLNKNNVEVELKSIL